MLGFGITILIPSSEQHVVSVEKQLLEGIYSCDFLKHDETSDFPQEGSENDPSKSNKGTPASATKKWKIFSGELNICICCHIISVCTVVVIESSRSVCVQRCLWFRLRSVACAL